MIANKEIRNKIESNRILYWEVAESVGIAQSTFSVWLRTELNEERKKRVESSISRLLNKNEKEK